MVKIYRHLRVPHALGAAPGPQLLPALHGLRHFGGLHGKGRLGFRCHDRLSTAGFPPTCCCLSSVSPVTREELHRIILTSAPKSCNLNSLPLFLLQESSVNLLPLIMVL